MSDLESRAAKLAEEVVPCRCALRHAGDCHNCQLREAVTSALIALAREFAARELRELATAMDARQPLRGSGYGRARRVMTDALRARANALCKEDSGG